MKVVLFGKLGMLGSQFLSRFAGGNDHEVFAFDKSDLDISDFNTLQKTLNRISPDLVVNCAAFTDVDACEENKDLAFKINAEAVNNIAALCAKNKTCLIHFSTDYVFDGERPDGYDESATPSPLSVYGESKLAGELAIQDHLHNYYIIRTSWLYGPRGKNFVDTMLSLAKTKESLQVVNDQFGSPTYTKDLVDAVFENFIDPMGSKTDNNHKHELKNQEECVTPSPDHGIYHLTNSGICSWHDFAKKIFEITNISVQLQAVDSLNFPRPAKRPKCSVLKNTKLKPLRLWEEALKNYLNFKTH